MKRYLKIIAMLILTSVTWIACKKDLPIDEDGLLITTRAECAVTNFDLLGSDYVTVRNGAPVIDTVAQTVSVSVLFGTDLRNLYPVFSLSPDCKLDPKIIGKVDFSDLSNPKEYTVVSGNRKVRKTYKVLITVQPR